MTIAELYGINEAEHLVLFEKAKEIAYITGLTLGEQHNMAIAYCMTLKRPKEVMIFMLLLGEGISARQLGVKKENYYK